MIYTGGYLIVHLNSLLVSEIIVSVIPLWSSFQKPFFVYSVALITSQIGSEKLKHENFSLYKSQLQWEKITRIDLIDYRK